MGARSLLSFQSVPLTKIPDPMAWLLLSKTSGYHPPMAESRKSKASFSLVANHSILGFDFIFFIDLVPGSNVVIQAKTSEVLEKSKKVTKRYFKPMDYWQKSQVDKDTRI